VSVSVTSCSSTETAERIEPVFDTEAYFDLSYILMQGNLVSVIRKFVPDSPLQKFCHESPIVATCQLSIQCEDRRRSNSVNNTCDGRLPERATARVTVRVRQHVARVHLRRLILVAISPQPRIACVACNLLIATSRALCSCVLCVCDENTGGRYRTAPEPLWAVDWYGPKSHQ